MRSSVVSIGCAWGVGLLSLVGAVDALAQLITRQEALSTAYPGAEIRAERVFLTREQQLRAAETAGVEVPSALVARYVAIRDGQVVGRAYVDTHVVRTKKESLIISLDANGALKRIEVTAFQEPSEYLPPRAWLNQYSGQPLADDLTLHRAIRPIAGATLTAKAVADAARRILAIDHALESSDSSRPTR